MFTYTKSKKYDRLLDKIMGPNPVKLCEELLDKAMLMPGDNVCDLGSGNGLTSVFMAKEYGYKITASDLWSDPDENDRFFAKEGLDASSIKAVKADAESLPFEKEYFDGIVCVDSYNYFGRDSDYLDKKLLPFLKHGGYVYLAITGMKSDLHQNLPEELLLSWTPEQLDYIQDIGYWSRIFYASKDSEIVEISEMYSNDEVWADWLIQENPYAIGDRKSMNAGAGKYMNFIKAVLRKK